MPVIIISVDTMTKPGPHEATLLFSEAVSQLVSLFLFLPPLPLPLSFFQEAKDFGLSSPPNPPSLEVSTVMTFVSHLVQRVLGLGIRSSGF